MFKSMNWWSNQQKYRNKRSLGIVFLIVLKMTIILKLSVI